MVLSALPHFHMGSVVVTRLCEGVGVRLPRHGSSEMSRAADLGEGEIGIPLKDGLTSPSTLVRLLRRTGIEFELMMIPSSSTTGVVSVPPEILLRRTRIEG